MKTMNSDQWQGKTGGKWQVAGDQMNRAASGAKAIRNSQFAIRNCPAFTLIELLVVISIIAILAAFTVPVLKSLKRQQFIRKTQAEMAQIETAIDSYKATHGFYPPGNPSNPFFSPLYVELVGTTNDTSTGTFYTLDRSASITVATLTMLPAPGLLGVSGFINCSKPGSGEDAPAAKIFLPDLKPGQIGQNMTNTTSANYIIPTTLLVASVGGPDLYKGRPVINPWRYVCPGTNNPGSYDLWVQLSIAGTTNLVCNWTRQIQKNNPLP